MAEGQEASFDVWGIHSGAMVFDGTVLENPWDAYNQEVSFFYETGPNDWNKMTFIKEAGSQSFVQFDKPMQFLYTHSNENDRNTNESELAGQSFLLEYGGAGNLWGFPELDDGRHMRAFSLNDGTNMSDQNGEYVTKAIELEKRMRELALDSCTAGDNPLALDEAASISLPTAQDVSEIAFGLGDKPEVEGAPRVVGGEIVED